MCIFVSIKVYMVKHTYYLAVALATSTYASTDPRGLDQVTKRLIEKQSKILSSLVSVLPTMETKKNSNGDAKRKTTAEDIVKKHMYVPSSKSPKTTAEKLARNAGSIGCHVLVTITRAITYRCLRKWIDGVKQISSHATLDSFFLGILATVFGEDIRDYVTTDDIRMIYDQLPAEKQKRVGEIDETQYSRVDKTSKVEKSFNEAVVKAVGIRDNDADFLKVLHNTLLVLKEGHLCFGKACHYDNAPMNLTIHEVGELVYYCRKMKNILKCISRGKSLQKLSIKDENADAKFESLFCAFLRLYFAVEIVPTLVQTIEGSSNGMKEKRKHSLVAKYTSVAVILRHVYWNKWKIYADDSASHVQIQEQSDEKQAVNPPPMRDNDKDTKHDDSHDMVNESSFQTGSEYIHSGGKTIVEFKQWGIDEERLEQNMDHIISSNSNNDIKALMFKALNGVFGEGTCLRKSEGNGLSYSLYKTRSSLCSHLATLSQQLKNWNTISDGSQLHSSIQQHLRWNGIFKLSIGRDSMENLIVYKPPSDLWNSLLQCVCWLQGLGHQLQKGDNIDYDECRMFLASRSNVDAIVSTDCMLDTIRNLITEINHMLDDPDEKHVSKTRRICLEKTQKFLCCHQAILQLCSSSSPMVTEAEVTGSVEISPFLSNKQSSEWLSRCWRCLPTAYKTVIMEENNDELSYDYLVISNDEEAHKLQEGRGWNTIDSIINAFYGRNGKYGIVQCGRRPVTGAFNPICMLFEYPNVKQFKE